MVYLDNSATTQPFPEVVEAVRVAMLERWMNPSALYAPAVEVRRQFEDARRAAAGAMGASGGRVVLTGGGTDGDNLALIGAANRYNQPGSLLVSALEHPAVGESAAFLKLRGWEIMPLPATPEGLVTPETVGQAADSAPVDRPVIVTCMQVNNETGARMDIEGIARAVKAARPDALVHCDGVQGFLRTPLNLKNVDLYTVSAHKVHGPRGAGALFVRDGVALRGVQAGGGQEYGLRSGTEDVAAALGFKAALARWQEEGAAWREELRKMKLYLLGQLLAIGDVRVNGPDPAGDFSAPHILNLSFEGVRAQVLLHALEQRQVYVSTGSACASHGSRLSGTLKAMGVTGKRAEGAIRLSLSPLNTLGQMDEAADAIKEMVLSLRQYRRR
ncbi:Cysteine desulfurase [uncultured Clostridium sp.]|nr:Cysteine desulfurase [uncultured Clostridium sp.]